MPVNVALGHLSNAFMIAALVIYSLSVFAFAGDFAFGRPRRAAAARGQQETRDREAALATVGAVPGSPGPRPRGRRLPRPPRIPASRRLPGAAAARPAPCPSWRFRRSARSGRRAAG